MNQRCKLWRGSPKVTEIVVAKVPPPLRNQAIITVPMRLKMDMTEIQNR